VALRATLLPVSVSMYSPLGGLLEDMLVDIWRCWRCWSSSRQGSCVVGGCHNIGLGWDERLVQGCKGPACSLPHMGHGPTQGTNRSCSGRLDSSAFTSQLLPTNHGNAINNPSCSAAPTATLFRLRCFLPRHVRKATGTEVSRCDQRDFATPPTLIQVLTALNCPHEDGINFARQQDRTWNSRYPP
jgi:hypothetical protein